MRQLIYLQVLIFFALNTSQGLIAQLTPAKMSSSVKTSDKIEGLKDFKPPEKKAQTPVVLPEIVKRAAEVVQHAEYLHPGILVNLGGAWEGSDHLLNLSNSIGVYVKIFKPDSETLEVTGTDLQKEVETIFNDASIKPLTTTVSGKPPLPAFEIEIFVYPIEKGYAAFVDGRLLESVVLDRFEMDSNMAFQAITWEKQSLIVSPKDKFNDQIKQAVKEISQVFATRYQSFEKLKNSSLK